MKNNINQPFLLAFAIFLLLSACKNLQISSREVNKELIPNSFINNMDTNNLALANWKVFFNDSVLISLIDTALLNNQELNIVMQELQLGQFEVLARTGEYQPNLSLNLEGGVEKVGRYTTHGASEATTDIAPGVETPEAVPNLRIGLFTSWEIDVWGKLRNSRKSANLKYLASKEGRNFMVTNLIAEISNTYYELLALDNQLLILNQNIDLQSNALEIVKLQKIAGRVTELAVKRFEAEVWNTKSLQYEIKQNIVETQNRLNFLVGRYPQTVTRNPSIFYDLTIDSLKYGIPSQLLSNRPDIRQAELELEANNLDIQVARAEFYPSLNIKAGIGYEAFNSRYFLQSPQSMIYSAIGELTAPLINRKALKAQYFSANARQIQSAYNYEQKILNAYVEVYNEISNISNLSKSYELKQLQVDALMQSIDISNDLFSSARADYMEILLTQRDALEAKMELVETKKRQLNAKVNIYRSLGGGWR